MTVRAARGEVSSSGLEAGGSPPAKNPGLVLLPDMSESPGYPTLAAVSRNPTFDNRRVPLDSGAIPWQLAMRICFVVNSVKTQRPTYTTAHLAFAAHRRGHDVALVSVDDLSHGGERIVFGDIVRVAGKQPDATAFVRALVGLVRAL
jgi:hypothetical protein